MKPCLRLLLHPELSGKAQGIQIIYGPVVAVIKSHLEDYLEKAPDEEYIPAEQEKESMTDTGNEENSGAENSSGAGFRNGEKATLLSVYR